MIHVFLGTQGFKQHASFHQFVVLRETSLKDAPHSVFTLSSHQKDESLETCLSISVQWEKMQQTQASAMMICFVMSSPVQHPHVL